MNFIKELYKSKENIYIICLGVFLFLLPFPIRYNNIGLVILILGWIVNFKKNEIKLFFSNSYNSIIYLLFVLFYGYFIIRGFSITNETGVFNDNAIKEYGRKIAFVLFPLFFNLKVIKEKYKILLRFFVYGVFLAMLACILNAIFINYVEGARVGRGVMHFNAWYFSNHLLVKPIQFHPTLFALVVSVILHLCVLHILNMASYKLVLFKSKITSFVMSVLLFLFLLALSSRNVLFFSLISISVLVIKHVITNKNYNVIMCFLIAIISLIAIELSVNHVNRKRVVDLLMFNKDVTEQSFGGSSFRIACANALYEDLIKENWLLGIGSGRNQQKINKAYLDHGLKLPAEENYNAHNQYLDTFIYNGVIGLLLLLVIYLSLFKFTYDNKLYFGFIIIYLLFTVSLTESILERQKGIWLFVTLIFVFIASNTKQK